MVGTGIKFLSTRLLRESINKKLEELEKRADRTPTGCVASQREIQILKENIEEAYSPYSSQLKRLKKLEKRVCQKK